MRYCRRLIAVVFLPMTCVGSSHDELVVRSRYDLVAIRRAIRGFQNAQQRLPKTLDEICPSMRGDRECHFWALGQPFVDAWQSPFRYELVEGEFELSSSGPDKQAGTADDITFRPSREREWVSSFAGCYQLQFSKWREFPGNVLVLDTAEHTTGMYALRPTIPGYRVAEWYPTTGDSVEVEWIAMHHSALLSFKRSGDSLSGNLNGGGGMASPGFGNPPKPERIAGVKISCGAPPRSGATHG